MDLEFIKKDNWEVEFKADSNFNLHIEGVPEGKVRIYQRGTAEGAYAYVRDATPSASFTNVYDLGFSAFVYPKWIKVVVGNRPSVGVVTGLGDVPSEGGSIIGTGKVGNFVIS